MSPNFDYAAVPERFLLAFLEDIAGYVERKRRQKRRHKMKSTS